MKKNFSKLYLGFVVFLFFIANMTFSSLNVNAQHELKEPDPDFENCYWQDYDGSNYTEFCGYEVHCESCDCGGFR